MKRRIVLPWAILLLLLGACSKGTVLTFAVDALPFLTDEDRQGQLGVGQNTSLELPDARGLSSADLGVPSALFTSIAGLALELDGSFALSGTTEDLTVTLGLYLGDGDSAFQATAPVTETVMLSPGPIQQRRVQFDLDESADPELFALIHSGNFLIGVRLTMVSPATGATLDYTLTAFQLGVSLRSGPLFPF